MQPFQRLKDEIRDEMEEMERGRQKWEGGKESGGGMKDEGDLGFGFEWDLLYGDYLNELEMDF